MLLAQNTSIPSTNSTEEAIGKIKSPDFIGSNTLGSFISNVYAAALTIAGIVLFIMLITASFKWMGSGDDIKAKASAQSTIINAIIGIVIIVVAWSLTVIIGQFLGISENILGNLIFGKP